MAREISITLRAWLVARVAAGHVVRACTQAACPCHLLSVVAP